MLKEKAKAHFLGQGGHAKMNCGQTIVHACKEKFNVPEELVAVFEGYGGGRAPEGLCGALYAAEVILKDTHPAQLKECKDAFVRHAGSMKCKDIRASRSLTCLGCVEKVAESLEKL